jgi:glycosyltransferase involved in cell wall biosynthesis
MKNKKFFFSIVTPTLNSKKFIKETFDSIYQQKFKDFEHIVVDGNSTDGTKKILFELKKKYKFKLIIKKDKSMYQALKYGFRICKGKYFYWLNSDDFFVNSFSLLNLYNFLKKNKYNWVNGRTAILYQEKNKLIKWIPLFYPRFILQNGWHHKCAWGFVQQENVIFSKTLYIKAGGLNSEFKVAGDHNLWIKFSKYEKLIPINIEISVHRKWKKQLTNNLKTYYFEIKKKQCNFSIFYPLRFLVSLLYFPIVYFRK